MISDDTFNEAYRPLHVPAAYNKNDSWRDKVIFALAQVGAGNTTDVAAKIAALDDQLNADEIRINTETILIGLFEKGLIKGSDDGNARQYNLSKILTPNAGETDAGL